jgi:hypothetical protein
VRIAVTGIGVVSPASVGEEALFAMFSSGAALGA